MKLAFRDKTESRGNTNNGAGQRGTSRASTHVQGLREIPRGDTYHSALQKGKREGGQVRVFPKVCKPPQRVKISFQGERMTEFIFHATIGAANFRISLDAKDEHDAWMQVSKLVGKYVDIQLESQVKK